MINNGITMFVVYGANQMLMRLIGRIQKSMKQ